MENLLRKSSTRLEKVVTYLVRHYPRAIRRTELVKAVYYFEYLHHRQEGGYFTETEFVRDFYGPNSQAVYETARTSAVIKERAYTGFYGRTYQYSISDESTTRDIIADLPPHIVRLLDLTIDTFAPLNNASQVKQFVYETPPMVKVLETEQGNPMYGRPLDMNEDRGIFKPTAEALKAARKRVDQSTRGSAEEYQKVLARELDDHKPLLERAIRCMEAVR